jgi:SagB-type dehydrogenase family enzyme
MLAGSLFARELMSLLSRAANVTLPMRWKRVDLDSLAASDQVGVSRPGCPHCSAAKGPMAATVSSAAVYEASVSMPPKAFADLKAHQMHYKPSNMALQQKFQSWPVAQKFLLPEPDLEGLGENDGGGGVDNRKGDVTKDKISVLLKLMAGIRFITDERVQRWTAAGGNIGSVTAYLIVRDCPGLKPGCYAYVAETHSLALLSELDDAITEGPSVSLILGGNYFKVASKYAAFALRIVLLDAGCALATGHQVAKALRLGFRVQTSWDDEALGRSLGLDLDLEPLTSVIAIGD